MTRKVVVINDKRYYTVSSVCAKLGIFKNTLYNWEKKGKIPKSYREPMSGWKLYTQKDIESLKKISGRK